MTQMYANWDRMAPAVRDAYRASAAAFISTLIPAALGWVH